MGETIPLQTALAIFHDHLADIKNSVAENMLWRIEQVPKPSFNFNQWFWIFIGTTKGLKKRQLQWIGEKIALRDTQKALYDLEVSLIIEPQSLIIKRIVSRQQNFGKVKQISDKVTAEQIERAREYPMPDLFGQQLYKSGSYRMTGRCPFHGPEKTPSFTIFLKTNKWRCFGCDKYGDTIQFLELLEGIRFKAAVRKLISY